MDNTERLRKRDRVRNLFRRKATPGIPPASFQDAQEPNGAVGEESQDRERTKALYIEAVKLLQDAIKGGGGGTFEFSELSGEPEDFNDPQFREKIDRALGAQVSANRDSVFRKRSRRAIESLLIALSPFAKTFLTIGKRVQSVFLSPRIMD